MSDTELNHALRAAIGWYELGMAAEALGELDRMPAADRDRTESLELRAVVLQQLAHWEAAAATYAQLCQRPNAAVERFIAWGCCLYELGRISECREALLAAPESARKHGLWNFHLACYESLLGHHEEARGLIQTSLRLDPRLRGMAKRNDNLAQFVE